MRIFGIGIDVVEIDRIERLLEGYGGRFAEKIFTGEERRYCELARRPAVHYAARFAAKEAVAKALGTGIGGRLGWLDMEIRRREGGAPVLVLLGAGRRFAAEHGIAEVMISMTHSRDHAAANAVAVVGAGT